MMIWTLLLFSGFASALTKPKDHKNELQQEPLSAPIIKTEILAIFYWLFENLAVVIFIIAVVIILIIFRYYLSAEIMQSNDKIYLKQQRDTSTPQYCL